MTSKSFHEKGTLKFDGAWTIQCFLSSYFTHRDQYSAGLFVETSLAQ